MMITIQRTSTQVSHEIDEVSNMAKVALAEDPDADDEDEDYGYDEETLNRVTEYIVPTVSFQVKSNLRDLCSFAWTC